MNGSFSEDAKELLDEDGGMKSDDEVRLVSVKDISTSVGSTLSFTILTGAGRPSISQCRDGAGRPKRKTKIISDIEN